MNISMSGQNSYVAIQKIKQRIRLCDYLCVAQLYLKNNFLLERALTPEDIKPRLLGHWGTCHGINVAYANLRAYFEGDPNFNFVLGPGHGLPALQANLWLDGELAKVDSRATIDADGLAYICQQFSWPDGFPSHASPMTPNIIKEGFLRSESALIQTIGRAARHEEGKVIMYANLITESMERAISETNRRREIQKEYNEKHGVTPHSIKKEVSAGLRAIIPEKDKVDKLDIKRIPKDELLALIKQLSSEMQLAAANLEFERAALLRDEIEKIKAYIEGK